MALDPNGNRIRLNITLDRGLLAEINEWCARFGCNRSAFIGIACRSKLDGEMMLQRMPEMLQLASEQLKSEREKKTDSE